MSKLISFKEQKTVGHYSQKRI